jgi:hypothetical protein
VQMQIATFGLPDASNRMKVDRKALKEQQCPMIS